jgi:hypothetical protein
MNHDFLIGSAQLNQAYESQESCGNGELGKGITRRSFVKRSGTAAVATLVAWQAMESRTFAEIPDGASGQGSWLLLCQDEPSKISYMNAAPNSLWEAVRQTLDFVPPTLDHNGDGVSWKLVHWLEIHPNPHRKDSAAVPGGELKGQITAHMAILKGQWTWEYNTSGWGSTRKSYEWTTECHLTAGGGSTDAEEYKATTSKEGENAIIVYNDSSDHSNKLGCHPINWNGEVIGWALVSYSVKNFKLRSDAIFVPKSILLSNTTGGGWNLNASLKVMEAITVGGGWAGSWSTTFGTNQEPRPSAITLDFRPSQEHRRNC